MNQHMIWMELMARFVPDDFGDLPKKDRYLVASNMAIAYEVKRLNEVLDKVICDIPGEDGDRGTVALDVTVTRRKIKVDGDD